MLSPSSRAYTPHDLQPTAHFNTTYAAPSGGFNARYRECFAHQNASSESCTRRMGSETMGYRAIARITHTAPSVTMISVDRACNGAQGVDNDSYNACHELRTNTGSAIRPASY